MHATLRSLIGTKNLGVNGWSGVIKVVNSFTSQLPWEEGEIGMKTSKMMEVSGFLINSELWKYIIMFQLLKIHGSIRFSLLLLVNQMVNVNVSIVSIYYPETIKEENVFISLYHVCDQ